MKHVTSQHQNNNDADVIQKYGVFTKHVLSSARPGEHAVFVFATRQTASSLTEIKIEVQK